jgi:type I restriction enzyme S subunit
MRENLKNIHPKYWEVERLGDFVITEKGKKPKNISNKYNDICHLPYVNIKVFEKNIIDEFTDGLGCVLCEEGDFVMVWDGSRSGYVGKAIKGALGSTLVRIKFPGIYLDYAYYFLQSKYLEINKRAKGVGIPHVDPALLWSYNFPIPPLREQHRIVAKIEELFSDLDKGVEALKTAQQQLKVYRQGVLKWAFEGKLTEEWRKQQKDLPTASQLLEKIKAEREKQAKATGKKLKPYIPLTKEEIAELPVLPNGWGWVKIEILSKNEPNAIKAGPFGSSLKKEYYVEKGYKIYGQEQVIAEDPYYGNYFISEEKYKTLISNEARPGDILISLVGTIGKVLILPEDAQPGIINPRLIKITLDTKLYLEKFFKFYFESSFLKRKYSTESQGTTMDILNMGMIKALPFPFLCIDEQNIIIQQIESRLSVADKVEETITLSLQQAEALRQSILKKTFEGKLVPQDPTDEPASKLLERIKTERSAQTPVKKTRKKKATQ